MPRILVLNNYPLDSVWQEVRQKDKPDHHLFGINYLKQFGYDVDIVPFQGNTAFQLADRLLNELPLPLGDLSQQSWILSKLEWADLIYSPCQTQSWMLALLRASGAMRKPLVCIAHHPLEWGRLKLLRRPYLQQALKGIDAFPSLSIAVSRQINSLAKKELSVPLQFGVDANYYPNKTELGSGIIAAGRTARDFATFALGASKTMVPCKIVCLQRDFSESFRASGKNVDVVIQPNENYMRYPDLIELYAQARAIAIPLYETPTLCGLTGLMDALGMGKPVLMTRNPLIDLDIEKEGIGFWIAPGDVEGWSRAIQFIESNPDKAAQMGERARALADSTYTSEKFAQQLASIFDNLLKR